jgi:predicted ArsR family transcriptional regulator
MTCYLNDVKYPKKKIVLERWEDMKLIFHPDRMDIVDICRREQLSIKELSIELNLNPGSIHNHVSKLLKSGYLYVAKTRQVNGITEKKYGTTSNFFSMGQLKGEAEEKKNQFVAKQISKCSYEAMAHRKEGTSVLMKRASLSEEDYDEAFAKLKDLVEFITDRNGSGDKKMCFTTSLDYKE